MRSPAPPLTSFSALPSCEPERVGRCRFGRVCRIVQVPRRMPDEPASLLNGCDSNPEEYLYLNGGPFDSILLQPLALAWPAPPARPEAALPAGSVWRARTMIRPPQSGIVKGFRYMHSLALAWYCGTVNRTRPIFRLLFRSNRENPWSQGLSHKDKHMCTCLPLRCRKGRSDTWPWADPSRALVIGKWLSTD